VQKKTGRSASIENHEIFETGAEDIRAGKFSPEGVRLPKCKSTLKKKQKGISKGSA